ncbi:MAG: TatD family hydrolase [Candidatus Anstonellaceae archaeon]
MNSDKEILEIFDAHCHENEGLEKVEMACISGYNYTTNLKALQIAKKFKMYCCFGFAPQELQRKEYYPNLEEEIQKIKLQIEKNLYDEHFVAIGEVGLDNHWAKEIEHNQRQNFAFREFIEIAKEYKLPLVIHSRAAEKECIEILIKSNVKKALLHCFGGNANEAKIAVEAGYIISIPPLRSKERKKIIQQIPLENLVIESDAPYLAKTSTQTIVAAQMISEYKKLEIEKVLEQTKQNAQKFFAKNF